MRRCRRLLWNQLWGVVLCAADSSDLACCYSRAMCLWPALGSGGETVCDVLSCCLWWISNCPPAGESDPAALLVSSAAEPRGGEEGLTVSRGPGS